MKDPPLGDMTLDQLVERFTVLAVSQDKSLLRSEMANVNRLNDALDLVEAELRAREGDRRDALLKLYEHPNPQVRLKAAKATLVVAPNSARRMLQTIAESDEFPQAGHAGMSLLGLERGTYKPK
jgi:hypothetical protein